jgi:hypothetical protein
MVYLRTIVGCGYVPVGLSGGSLDALLDFGDHFGVGLANGDHVAL